MPVKMHRPQAVAIGDEIFVGGGNNGNKTDLTAVLKYSTVKDEWTFQTDRSVIGFGLCQFQRELLSVGGMDEDRSVNNVYCYSTIDNKWVESLRPMLTRRAFPAVLTTASAIIVCGGQIRGEDGLTVRLATVEVYSSTTSQWHTADPLPQPCTAMTSITISGSGFLLGGMLASHKPIKLPFCVDMATLINRATSLTRRRDTTSTWKTLPDTPLALSTAATLSGGLLAVGGGIESASVQSSVYVFIPSANSWVKLSSGDLPVKRAATAAVHLTSNAVMIMGGLDKDNKDRSTCYIGSVVV